MIRQVDATLQDATGKARQALLGGCGVDGGKRAGMPRIEQLQKVEGLPASNLAQDDAVGTVPKGGFQEVANCDGGQAILLAPRLKPDEVTFVDLDLGGVFDDDDPLIVGNIARPGYSASVVFPVPVPPLIRMFLC